MKCLLIGHLIADFYLQSEKMAKGKQKESKILLMHCLIYAICIYLCAVSAADNVLSTILPSLICGILHYLIDFLKIKLVKYSSGYPLIMFFADQLLHILVLILVFQPVVLYQSIVYVIGTITVSQLLSIIIGLLVCGKPAAVFIAIVFAKIPKTIEASTQSAAAAVLQSEHAKIGSWIGILERTIIYILGMMGEYGAIGFVLAAKSIARHKQLNEPAFAEKYLVGTLLSSLIALSCAVLCTYF